MRDHRALWTYGRSTLAAVFAAGLASAAASGAWAQGANDQPPTAPPTSAAPAQTNAPPPGSNPVSGVTVEAPRPGSGGAMIPDDKAAALAAEAARQKAWKDYRKSMPRLTPDLNDLSKDYPVLQELAPKP